MRRACALLPLLLKSSAQAGPPSRLQRLVAAGLERELGPIVRGNNAGMWFALVNGTERFAVPLGYSDDGSTPAGNSDILPIGSYAKPWTAVAIMRLIEQGAFRLDSPAAPLIDPFLTAINGTTLRQLWGPRIGNVTVRMLLHMTSGLSEYSTSTILRDTLLYPDWDISPQDYLALEKKIFVCDPGTCSRYCSINYLLLGLLWAGQTHQHNWDTLDQKTALPLALRGKYNGTTFFMHGHCAKYPNVAHYFHYNGIDQATGKANNTDMYNRSCLNGYAFGNIGSTALDCATFFYDLLGPVPRIVSSESVRLMQQFGPGHVMGADTEYGLGIWRTTRLSLGSGVNASFPGILPYLTYVGHAGDDWDTVSRQAWHPKLGISFSMMINRWVGDYPKTPTQLHCVFCRAWKVLFEVLVAEALPGVEEAFLCDTTHLYMDCVI